jgi:hypothetical protein
MLSQLLGFSHHVDVGTAADNLEAHAASIFGIDIHMV